MTAGLRHDAGISSDRCGVGATLASATPPQQRKSIEMSAPCV